jgi:UDP-N-acetylmuramoyl-tripeptide--D-alanyl-D-alanine ligase
VVDSRLAGPGDLFVGLPGTQTDGGAFAPQALAAGAWGVLVGPEHADAARCAPPGVLLAAEDSLLALQALGRAWRRALGARVVAVTGSTGKTSTKDIVFALLSRHLRTVASRENLNTEIGLPLAVLEAPAETEALVLELAMRGKGQIAELAAIAEPDVGVIVNVGPVHLELLGTLEAVAAAKAELIGALVPGATAVVPAGEALLEPYLRPDVSTVTFGPDGDVRLVSVEAGRVIVAHGDERLELEPNFSSAHQLNNLLAAVAAARAVGVRPEGPVDVRFSAMRGERIALPGSIVIVNDCYNANPMSMAAALEDLAAMTASRRVAVLGDMLELGPEERRFHAEVGAHAAAQGVDVLVTVGPRAAAMAEGLRGAGPQPEHHPVADAAEAAALVPGLLEPGDAVLIKGSRGVELERVAERLVASMEGSAPDAAPIGRR